MKRRLLITLAVLISLLCAGAILLLKNARTMRSAPVGFAIVADQVNRIDAPISGKVLGTAVTTDDRVKEGDLLFTMALAESAEMARSYHRHMQELQGRINAMERDEGPLTAADAAEICLAEERALGEEIAALLRHTASLDRIAAEARVSLSREPEKDPKILKLSQWVDARAERWELIREMADRGAVPQSDVELAELHLERARGDWEQAKSVYEIARLKEQNAAEAAERESAEIATLIIDLRREQTDIAAACRLIEGGGDGLAAASHKFLGAALRAAEILWRRNSTREVRAQRDSVVVQVEVEEGQEVQAGDTIMSMRVGDGPWIDAYFARDVDLGSLGGALLLDRDDGFRISATLVGSGTPCTTPLPDPLGKTRPGLSDGTYARLEILSVDRLAIGDVFEVWALDDAPALGGP